MTFLNDIPGVGQIIDVVKNPSNRVRLKRKLRRMRNIGATIGSAAVGALAGSGGASLVTLMTAAIQDNTINDFVDDLSGGDVDKALTICNITLQVV